MSSRLGRVTVRSESSIARSIAHPVTAWRARVGSAVLMVILPFSETTGDSNGNPSSEAWSA